MQQVIDPSPRAVVLSAFFSADMSASRPRFAAEVLSKLMPVDVVTSDFDHGKKVRRDSGNCPPIAETVYLKTLPYISNVSVRRLVSHVLFALKAAAYFRRNRKKYTVVYSTVPLNLLTWLVFMQVGTGVKIVDVVDIWPDVLPFPPRVRKIVSPALAAWRWLFKAAIRKADLVMAVSDEFLVQTSKYARSDAQIRRFYIGHRKLESTVPKQPVFTIAYVGNIGHLYDFDTLLDVLSDEELRNKVQLSVVGKGDRETWLGEELQRRKVRHRMYGVVFDSQRLGEILRSCHAGFNGYVNTSAAFSYKAGTYLAAGLPLINSMKGDLQHIVSQYGLGENYDGGNKRELKACLLRLCNNDTSAVSARCERFFATELNAPKMIDDMREFLRSYLEGRFGSGTLLDMGLSRSADRA